MRCATIQFSYNTRRVWETNGARVLVMSERLLVRLRSKIATRDFYKSCILQADGQFIPRGRQSSVLELILKPELPNLVESRIRRCGSVVRVIGRVWPCRRS